MAVTLHYVSQGKPVSISGRTLSINDHGAMVVAAHDLPLGTRLEIENTSTGQRQSCRITRPPRETPDGFQIPVEFDPPAPGFWHISFPPTA